MNAFASNQNSNQTERPRTMQLMSTPCNSKNDTTKLWLGVLRKLNKKTINNQPCCCRSQCRLKQMQMQSCALDAANPHSKATGVTACRSSL
eukprot:m.307579 g.307579  ORF g.307579 m.307579 type:complete len:91 (+) comp15935_c0_seq2:8205-8477(+)